MRRLNLSLMVLCSFFSFLNCSAQTEVAKPSSSPAEILEKSSDPGLTSEIAREVSSFSDFFREQAKYAFKGVVLGNLLAIDPRYLYVKPKERGLSRMFIYLDPSTQFTKMSKGKRLKGKSSDLLEGQRMAVRVIIKEGVILADEVFIVEGNFDPISRYRKRVIFKAKEDGKKAEGEKGKKPEKSEHAPKKSGGH